MGTSVDPSTWFSQNITLLANGSNPPQRTLKRSEIPKQINEFVQQVTKSNELILRGDGVNFGDASQEDKKREYGYIVMGQRDVVRALVKEIREKARSPKEFVSRIAITEGYTITENFLQDIK